MEVSFYNQSVSRKSGFTHISSLYIDGALVHTYKAIYHHRTWEAYQYQSVMKNVIREVLNKPKTFELTAEKIEALKSKLAEL